MSKLEKLLLEIRSVIIIMHWFFVTYVAVKYKTDFIFFIVKNTTKTHPKMLLPFPHLIIRTYVSFVELI